MTIQDKTLFLRQFKENFMHVGAILPSSAALGRAGAAYITQQHGPIRVLEAGAGTGSFTREIIPRLQNGDILDTVEINPTLSAQLQNRLHAETAFQPAPGVTINLIVADLLQFPTQTQYDYIVFSLPLTNFPPSMVQQMLTLMMAHLKPGGVFSYVKYIFIGQLKYWFGSSATRQQMDETQQIIQGFAHQYQIERRVVLKNVPPSWVHYWRKP